MAADSFDAFYASAPAEQRERLRRFRAAHPPRQIDVDGVRWEYLACGQGEQTVLLLVGGLRVADAAFRSISMLEDEFRVITPSYPPVRTMAQLGDGLARILEIEGVTRARVLAGSFGGMVAQCFVRQHPERVDGLILSTTGALDAESAALYRQQAEMLAALPAEMALAGAKDRFLAMVAPPDDERAFWQAYIDELFTHRLDKDDLLSTLACILDFADNYRLAPADLSGWNGRILILESDDDQTIGEPARQALHSLYPQARVHTFYGAGHSPGTTQREAYFAQVKAFLRG